MSNRNRTPVRLGRPRSEIVAAVIVSAAILVVAALAVWLLRPGAPGVRGGGGLAARQPRAALLIALVLIAGIFIVMRIRRRPPRRFSLRTSLALGLGGLAVVAILAAVFWPGGLLRDYGFPSFPNRPEPPTSVPGSSTPTTAAPSTSAPPTSGPSGSSGG